jgi:putative molybdopterin biosynthesis protein
VSLNAEVLAPGMVPQHRVAPGTASTIATGALLPRGADCAVMVEHTDVEETPDGPRLRITHAAAPGQNVTFAGTDIARGETVLWTGTVITSREIGLLAAIGLDRVDVYRRPRVAIISTGDEIVPAGQPLPPGGVYDSNAPIIAAAVEELGGIPELHGTIRDDEAQLRDAVTRALECDLVLLSGGTSKGAGDVSYRIVSELGEPGVIAHGVALKPGKPICLAVTNGKPVVVLPGFPTSAIFTFHEFVAPVLRAFAGLRPEARDEVFAVVPHRINSDRGRTEYVLVGLVPGRDGLAAYPLGKGSGSVSTFSLADGFITIDQQTEIVEAGAVVPVTLIDRQLRPADLVTIGSHCIGLDLLLGDLRKQGMNVKTMHVGSTAGLRAAQRGECDIAGIHLLDPATDEYNRAFVTPDLELVPGYRRMQCVVFRPGDARFAGKAAEEAIRAALADPECVLINRNTGSGTRILLDRMLEGLMVDGLSLIDQEGDLRSGGRHGQETGRNVIPGYGVQAKSHTAVAAAIAQGRADWGLCIDTVARMYGLDYIPVRDEHYDFVIPRERAERPAVIAFRKLLALPETTERLAAMGFRR